MIGLTECIAGLSGMVETVFGAPPVTKDVREGFTRPATYLTPIDARADRTGALRHETVFFELVHFAARTDRGWKDLLTAHKALVAALEGPVRVADGFHLLAEDADFDLDRETMSLTCTFEVELFQASPMADWTGGSDKNMDTLELDGKTVAAPED